MSGSKDNRDFKGFMIQARVGNAPVGRFIEERNVLRPLCAGDVSYSLVILYYNFYVSATLSRLLPITINLRRLQLLSLG